MRITVVGAGAIGGLIAGYLKLRGEDVSLVARGPSLNSIREHGLKVTGVRGEYVIRFEVSERVLGNPELVILATKTQDIESALGDNVAVLSGAHVLTTQNGVQADSIVLRFIPSERIISSIVMFGATSLMPGEVVHNFEGAWLIGKPFAENNDAVTSLSKVLDAVSPTMVSSDIKGMKYLKVFVNASNCIPALLGSSMQEAFADVAVSRISIALWKEGLETVKKAGVVLASLPDFSLERLNTLVSLPAEEAAKIFSRIMTGLSKEPLYGSILQSIKRGKPSEIDYINGEFIHLAKKTGAKASLNEKMVAMVHEVERTGRFFTKEELFEVTRGLVG